MKEKATLYRAEQLDELLVFKAQYDRFQFTNHVHDEFALGIMESGVQKFSCRGNEHFASEGSLITVNPDEVHNGQSANDGTFRYRVIYVPFDLMQDVGTSAVAYRPNHYFGSPVTVDPQLASCLAQVLFLLEQKDCELLEVQTLFYSVLTALLLKHGTESDQLQKNQLMSQPVDIACTFISDMARESISLDDIAKVAGLSRFHFLRVFTRVTGMSPHAYLTQRRLELAKASIRKNVSLADAALEAGFADQSHLSRRFKSAFGITVGQYKKAVS